MTELNLKSELTSFISDELLGGENVQHDDELLTEGMIDSIGMMRLVAFIEESLSVSIPPEDFTIENFASINGIDTYLMKQRNGRQQAEAKNAQHS